jgi:hypothetical protein
MVITPEEPSRSSVAIINAVEKMSHLEMILGYILFRILYVYKV